MHNTYNLVANMSQIYRRPLLCNLENILILAAQKVILVWFIFKVSLFLAHLSWKLKWAFLITFCPSSVRPSVCPSVCPPSVRPSVRLSVCKLFTFSSSSPEPLGKFQSNLAQSILKWRGFKFVQMNGHALIHKEVVTKYGA